MAWCPQHDPWMLAARPLCLTGLQPDLSDQISCFLGLAMAQGGTCRFGWTLRAKPPAMRVRTYPTQLIRSWMQLWASRMQVPEPVRVRPLVVVTWAPGVIPVLIATLAVWPYTRPSESFYGQ